MNNPVPNQAAQAAAQDPLAALRGIHLPDAVSFWPLAPGWWVALGIVLAIAVATFVWLRWRRASLVQHALRELDGLAKATSPEADLQGFAMGVSELLRRVALKRFGSARVASLHGMSWQQFLTETSARASRRRVGIGVDTGRVLALAPYVPPGAMSVHMGETTLDRAVLMAAAKNWIRWNS